MKTMILNSGLKIYLLFILVISSVYSVAQDDFYDLNTIQQIEISFIEPNWDYILDTAKAGAGNYHMSQWVKINGVQFDSTGVKYKGSSSYDPTFLKNPFHISLDEFKNQSYQGISSIKLANGYGDPSMIREVLSYSILSNYMDCPQSNYASVYVNGDYLGLYSNDESVNKKFCSSHFYSSGNTFIKGSPLLPGPNSKSNLKYISSDSSDYFGKYEIGSDYGWNDLVELCNILKNDIGSTDDYVDVDRILWMLAFNNVLVNLDSYSGWFSQNYYLYRDNSDIFTPVVWDLNMSLGGFPFAGTQGGGSGSLTVDEMMQLTPLLHDNQNDWPLIYVILSNPSWKRMYFAHMRTIIQESFASGEYLDKALALQTLINDAVQSDLNKFFTYEQFVNGMNENTQVGSYIVPGIVTLMEARADYLMSTPGLSEEPPQISDVVPSNTEPLLDEEITITTLVTGQGQLGVYLGLRHDKEEKFQRQLMYDDGNHNDGEAGDDVYGASFIMSSLIAQYYIYAEIDEVGDFAASFSPERAEHEFYTLFADVPTAEPGDIVINEFLAKNNTDSTNEYGNYEDWIELFNLTDEPLDLYGLYLTDDYSDPIKYGFPENSIIQPKSFLMVWADEEDTVSSFLHANFKLSADGESLMLSNGDGLVLDSLTYSTQNADISSGRCPNGSGLFSDLEYPTFGTDNYCPAFVSDKSIAGQQFIVLPNPFRDHVTVTTSSTGKFSVVLFNSSGLKMAEETSEGGMVSLDTSHSPAGIYIYLVRNENGKVTGSGKIVKLK